MSLIGAVILVGIVVNDSIVKVDFINQARRQGMALRDAILEAGRVRLRPIIMTTVTTVLGLTPMALGSAGGPTCRAPLAIAVIGGLIVATLLTLIVVPVVYSLVEGLRVRVVGVPRFRDEPRMAPSRRRRTDDRLLHQAAGGRGHDLSGRGPPGRGRLAEHPHRAASRHPASPPDRDAGPGPGPLPRPSKPSSPPPSSPPSSRSGGWRRSPPSPTNSRDRGVSNIQVEFARETDMDFARLDLSERLATLEEELPPGVRSVTVAPYVPPEFSAQAGRAFLRYTLTGPYTLEALRTFLDDQVAPELGQMDGVAVVRVYGGRDRLVEIEMDEDQVTALGLTPAHGLRADQRPGSGPGSRGGPGRGTRSTPSPSETGPPRFRRSGTPSSPPPAGG